MESMNSSSWSRSASVSSRGFLLRRVKSMSIAIAAMSISPARPSQCERVGACRSAGGVQARPGSAV